MPPPDHTLYVVFLGPPGSGKGTQAKKIIDKYHVFHLSTGDMLREMAASGSDLGKKVKVIIDKGELVPNNIMFEILEKKITAPECKHGVIFDGFPRNNAQAEEVPDEDLVSRITGRLIHEPSGRTYHIKTNPPKIPMKDDVTGEPLIQRPDDNAIVLKERLKIYHSQTAPLIQFYKDDNHKGLLHVIDASKPLETVFKDVEKCVSAATR